MDLDPAVIASLLVGMVAAGSAYASQRAAARASTINTDATSRVEMEKEAYERARRFDTETISRQDSDIDELRQENEELQSKVRALIAQIIQLEQEKALGPKSRPTYKEIE